MKKKIFVSYSHKDKQFVDTLIRDLMRADHDVFLDRWEMLPGDSIFEKIGAGLDDSWSMIVILSRISVKSSWVREEINAGLHRQLESKSVFILPALIQKCQVPAFLREKIYADFTSDYKFGLSQLLKSINRLEMSLPQTGIRPDIFPRYDDIKKTSEDHLLLVKTAKKILAALVEFGDPDPEKDSNIYLRYHTYFSEASFVVQNYLAAAESYRKLFKFTQNNVFLLMAFVCQACAGERKGAQQSAEEFFSKIEKEWVRIGSSEGNNFVIDLHPVLDQVLSLLFGEKFGLKDPMTLLYNNNEILLKFNIERSVEALFRSLAGEKDDSTDGQLTEHFGDLLVDLGVPFLGIKYLNCSRDEFGRDVSSTLAYANELNAFGFDNAKVFSLHPIELMTRPPIPEISISVRSTTQLTRISMLFGKYIDWSPTADSWPRS